MDDGYLDPPKMPVKKPPRSTIQSGIDTVNALGRRPCKAPTAIGVHWLLVTYVAMPSQ